LTENQSGVVGFVLATSLDFSEVMRYHFALKLLTISEVLQRHGARKGVVCA
jgi:hypothetical protein